MSFTPHKPCVVAMPDLSELAAEIALTGQTIEQLQYERATVEAELVRLQTWHQIVTDMHAFTMKYVVDPPAAEERIPY